MRTFQFPLALLLASVPAVAGAQEAGADAKASVSTAGLTSDAKTSKSDAKPAADAKKNSDSTPWIKRYRPTRNMVELGIYGGILLPAQDHELYDPTRAWQPYKRIAPDIGLRVGYYPLSFFGLEIEGGVAPTKVADGGGAVLGMFRGYGILQLPYRIAPFALFGAGLMGTSGIGKDVDPTLHFGGGVKFYVNRLLALRLDVRDNLTGQYRVDAGRTHHLEVLLGLSLTLGRKKDAPAQEKDSDGDGYLDSKDDCPTTPGVAPRGCPAAAEPDSDGDGFLDSVDACPQEPGIAPDGCPEKDRDGDGFLDGKDSCPDEPGVAPDGCPIPDKDGDKIPDPDDKCVEQPETVNGYQDADGCPDEVPKKVQKFAGVIEGIFFDVDKDTIKPASRAKLDAAVKVLKEFPDVGVEISGHTDSDGDRDHNIDLSRRRADAVKKYLADKGVDAGRMTTRGAGPDEPIADNATKAGKAKNRRIEFKLR
ncbi:OmpA family protein [Nannocystis pusilla]|uniref:OmpA family protein n=1 Tax=Nannocystis pusilla TaxID=889268 RepID=A0ABS7TQU5_9BACT|nr:OmpA family protein [Nannocystis pusilla]MBZ5710598.1 OmpA family protein [Nannocystis pusilla]